MAQRALAAVAHVGFGGGRLAKEQFSKEYRRETAPLFFWKRILFNLRKMPEVCAGAFLVFLIVDGLYEKKATEEEPERVESGRLEVLEEESSETLREKIKQFVLSRREIKKLEFYPQMVEIAAGSIFVEG
jgi:hypothetical protein